jgi:hypothetical protein
MPRKRVEDKWPWPHESAYERREHVARLYREELLKLAPEICLQLDVKLTRLGQGWAAPQPAIYKAKDLLTVELVADLERVSPRTVDNWVADGLLKATATADGNRFVYEHVLEFRANQRRRRIEQRRQRRADRAALASKDVVHVP